MRIWEKAGEFDPAKGSPIAWMATIARNRALDEVRRVTPGVARGYAGRLRAGRRGDRSARRARRSRNSWRRCCVASRRSTRRSARPCCSPIIAAFSREALAKRFGRAGADDQDLAASQPRAAEGLPVVMSLSPGRRLRRRGIRARHARSGRARRRRRAAAARAGTRRGDRRLGGDASRRSPKRCRRSRRRATISPTSKRASAPPAAPPDQRRCRRRSRARLSALARGGDRRVRASRRCWRSASSRARRRRAADAARIRRHPAEERRLAGLRRHRQYRHARAYGASGRRAAAGGQVLRIVDHRPDKLGAPRSLGVIDAADLDAATEPRRLRPRAWSRTRPMR